jgi:hypothetical protein
MVKVNYTKDRKLTGITAMLKVTGYDPADRDWDDSSNATFMSARCRPLRLARPSLGETARHYR